MDDFGTGYSSLGYLLSFPFSKIKIDRSFITGLPDKNESRAIVRAIADLARNLNMRVVAEGVETAQQLEHVRELGCTDMQGNLFSPARPVAEIHQLFLPKAKDAVSVVSQDCLGATIHLSPLEAPDDFRRPTRRRSRARTSG
jgi:EAL domain-containing protein (putative c-di-GMP-specific phosphodiesterase class I)